MPESQSTDGDEERIGYMSGAGSQLLLQFCTDCGEGVSRDVEPIKPSDVEDREKLVCSLCNKTFHDNGTAVPIIDSTVHGTVTAHDFTSGDETVRKGDVRITTEITIECTCERDVTITGLTSKTCPCGREWDIRHEQNE